MPFWILLGVIQGVKKTQILTLLDTSDSSDPFGRYCTCWTFLDILVTVGCFWTIFDAFGHFGRLWTLLAIFDPFWTPLDSLNAS